ncbi:MAG TPA: adenylate/guanylate cyclase domain-containing protein [Candidatus Limnocylindria bacterium]|nr:adenylate/guanylate cyclase domain-containing protein [Candidatus Limnocylindria bacterium]
MPEERKLATILFADIVGSTETGAAHDPEVVRRELSRAFAEMRQILERHGGTVEKFIGDAVMAVFGVPVAHDDDADRAVRAAFALRDRIAALSAGGRIPLELRLGLNTGQVVAGTGGETLVTGPAVNEAARLQQAAASGEILAGALTRRLTSGGVEYGPVRRVEAKGVGELEVAPAERLASAVPEQHRGIAGLQAPLIGRDEELRLLVDAYRKVEREERASLVTIYGDAGVGKSRLVRELVEALGDARVRRGRCLPYGEGITFWPVVEILRADAGITAQDTYEQATLKLRAAVLAAFGEATDDADAVARRLAVLAGIARAEDALPEVAADGVPNELRWGLRRYVELRAADEPLTLVFDDIQWAEPALYGLIEHLAEWTRAPAFLVCLARPEMRERRPGWGGGLLNAAAIRLDPLSEDESRRLIARLLDIDDLPEGVRAEVVRRAEGNPLYVEEFLRMLIDAGGVARRGGRFVATASLAELEVPPTLRGLIAARLDAAPAAVKHALQRASVVGKVFWPEAVAALGGVEGRADDVLLEAARRELVAELDERGPGGGRAWTFRHILVRDVAYVSLPKEERSRAHDLFGRWLEAAAGARLDEYADIVAYHAEQAFLLAHELGDPAAADLGRRALEGLMAAGRKARQRADAHASLAFHRRAQAIAQATAAPAAERVAAAGLAASARLQIESSDEALAEVRALLPEARAAGPSEALVALLVDTSFRTFDDKEQAFALDREAVEVARALRDPETIAFALFQSSWTPWGVGDLDMQRRCLLDALEHMRASGARRMEFGCLAWLANNGYMRGDFAAAHAYHEEAARRVAEGSSPLQRMFLTRQRGGWALSRGDLATAASLERDQLRQAQDLGLRSQIGVAHMWLARVLRDSGDLAAARAALESAVAMLAPAAEVAFRAEARAQLARVCVAMGDLEEARAQADTARAEVEADDAFTQCTSRSALAQVRAFEGRAVEAEGLFREALEGIARTGYRALHAEYRRDYGAFLLDQGRVAEARRELEAVRAFFGSDLVALERDKTDALLRRAAEAEKAARR